MAKIKTHQYLKKKTVTMKSEFTSIIKTAITWIAIIIIVSILVRKIPEIKKVMIKSLPVNIEIEAAGKQHYVESPEAAPVLHSAQP